MTAAASAHANAASRLVAKTALSAARTPVPSSFMKARRMMLARRDTDQPPMRVKRLAVGICMSEEKRRTLSFASAFRGWASSVPSI